MPQCRVLFPTTLWWSRHFVILGVRPIILVVTLSNHDIIAFPRPLISINDLIRGSVRAVRGVWDSGATIIHRVVELEGGITRRIVCSVGVAFAFPVSMCDNCCPICHTVLLDMRA